MATILDEYMLDFSGGQNASLDPTALPQNAYSSSVNTTNSNGVLRPRWGFRKIKLDFSETPDLIDSNGKPVKAEALFIAGRFQSIFDYPVGADQNLIIVISGFLFLVHEDSYKVEILNPNDPLDVNAARINTSPAGRFHVLFDYPSVPLILEGLIVRRSDQSKNEVPVSVIGSYNQNVLMIANAGNEFTFSDPAAVGFPDGPITFTLVELPSTGFTNQIFQLSTNYNNAPITAMGFLQQTDTTTGIGQALISTRKQLFSYLTQNPRTAWTTNQFGSVLLNRTGIAGQRSQVNINSDLHFISTDGQIRALSMSRYEQGRWGNFPISIEVSNYTQIRDTRLAQFIPAGYYGNKAFYGANPFRATGVDIDGNVHTDYACGGFVVLELNSVSGLGNSGIPSWAGLWTGIRPMDIVESNEQSFVISKDKGYGNALYLMDPTITYDVIDGKERQIKSLLYTRGFNFQQPGKNKLLTALNLTVTDIGGDFEVSASYKPEHAANYTPWRTFAYQAPVTQCYSNVNAPNGAAGQSIRDLYLGGIPEEDLCANPSNENYAMFKETQLLLEITGRSWNLTGFNLKALIAEESGVQVYCDSPKPQLVPLQCLKDWRLYDDTTNCN